MRERLAVNTLVMAADRGVYASRGRPAVGSAWAGFGGRPVADSVGVL